MWISGGADFFIERTRRRADADAVDDDVDGARADLLWDFN